ncbi:MAG: pyridoxal-phosphate dependent enzyme [SAR324 cluster bacterium]|nr:pyridoxal-phosphate dependent enzyme [SAR324 cluster bacterium]
MSTEPTVDFSHIESAAERLAGEANRTPVMTSRTLDQITGCRVFLKCENFQRAGAFKFRGAYNAMSRLNADEKAAGVVTHSSGNHAQATALAGRLLDVRVTVAMPLDAPAVKRKATEGYGAEVVTYDPATEVREEVTEALRAGRGLVLIPPFDHPHVIAGQGTAALELMDAVRDGAGDAAGDGRGVELEAMLAPCGGGGLLSGTAIACKSRLPGARVIGVEPEGSDCGNRAFHGGAIARVSHPQTMADGLKSHALGGHTFAAIREHVDQMVTVSEDEIRDTLRFLWERMKLVVEPSGAVGLAPLFHRKLGLEGRAVGVIISGGNADVGAVAEWLGEAAVSLGE